MKKAGKKLEPPEMVKNGDKNCACASLRGLLDQLTTEASQEKCDTRRLMLLKSQVYMLERQCYSMSLQINQRNESIEQAYNTLENIVAEMDGWSGSETSDNIVIKRSDYENVLKTVRGVGMRFNKISETSETIKEKRLIDNKYSSKVKTPGDMYNYNIKQMSNLENKLSELAGSMEQFRCTLTEVNTNMKGQVDNIEALQSDISKFSTLKRSYNIQYEKLLDQLNDCCYNVTQLSLLQPQAPYKSKNITKELTLDDIKEFVTQHTKKPKVLDVISLIWKISHQQSRNLKLKSVMLDGELSSCHKRLELHTQFVVELLSGIQGMFADFEVQHVTPLLISPLNNLLSCYEILQNEQTTDNLTTFFRKFDSVVPAIQNVVKILKTSTKMENSSELQKLFKNQIFNFTKSCLVARKEAEERIILSEKEHVVLKKQLSETVKGT